MRATIADLGFGWTFLRKHPGLLGTVVSFSVMNLFQGVVIVLMTPLVLATASPAALGTILSVGGLGMVAGSAAMGVWGGPKRRVRGILVFQLLGAFFVALAALRPWPPLYALATFGFLFTVPLTSGCALAIAQRKVPAPLQGRVFAMRRMIAFGSLPIAYLIAGPLAAFVEPLLVTGGALERTAGAVVGVGPGRGIAFLFLVTAVMSAVTAILTYASPRVRFVETELPELIS